METTACRAIALHHIHSNSSTPRVRGRRRPLRNGAVAVEAAFLLPVLITLMLGVWEVGRIIQVQEILANAVREGARVAAGATSNNTDVTVAMVQAQVQNYMTASGLPTAAVSGSTVTLTNLSANSWTDPCDAQPLDKFSVSVSIPSGTAFNSLRWVLTSTITGMTSLNVSTTWLSANDSELTVNSSLPY
jgi:Flp pilus assembly protein TadG